MQAFQVDLRTLERNHEIKLVLLVAQKQVLGMRAFDLAAQRLGLLDGEYRRMRHGLVGDAKTIQISEQSVGRVRHSSLIMAVPRGLQMVAACGYRNGTDAGVAQG